MDKEDNGLIVGPDGALRCFWPGSEPDYLHYHDHEWGRPVTDDRRLFEKICLEGFQSGLSWITILRKRENFREAFSDFDFEKLAAHGDPEVERHLLNAGIIRHRGKIASVFNNARKAVEMCERHGSLARWFWSFEPGADERPPVVDLAYARANPTTPVSTRISKELKALGWTFVGPTTVYAFMQAMGLVNDHMEGCVCRELVELERSQFKRP
ncbi:DNA-3-methyladenine glycosylase I [Mesorhizobium sp. Z1-4]|uniref:DNA-3-methyladenine glycosylase I n=1 Tax=Mesorhizobium sp. Z1-4 TaxID=2448478 RepID=UPI000FDAB47A|nr:DNA-3-methyladenine glycosylase I [Mesorhizobium sp. Z1-4]